VFSCYRMCSLANDTVNKHSTHIPTRVHVCMCVCVCAYTRRGKHSTHIFTRAHVCVCVCVCVCVYTHTSLALPPSKLTEAVPRAPFSHHASGAVQVTGSAGNVPNTLRTPACVSMCVCVCVCVCVCARARTCECVCACARQRVLTPLLIHVHTPHTHSPVAYRDTPVMMWHTDRDTHL